MNTLSTSRTKRLNSRIHRLQHWLAVAVLLSASSAALATGEIEILYSDRPNLVYNDVGSGADRDGSFWFVSPPAFSEYRAFSFLAMAGYSPPAGGLVTREIEAGALALPTSYSFISNDTGSGADRDGSWWKPNPPPGYRCLGTVVTNGATPSTESVRCVRNDLAVEGTVGDLIWNDVGSGADRDFAAWDIECPAGSIDGGGFIGVPNYSTPTEPVYCIAAAAIAEVPAPSQATIDSLIATFGPIIRFHPQEDYLPGDPAVNLDEPNALLVWGLLQNGSFAGFDFDTLGSRTTSSATILDDVQDALSNPSASDPKFKYFLWESYADNTGSTGEPDSPLDPLALGDLGNAKVYVRVQPFNGIFVELQFWIYYPWNDAGKIVTDCGIAWNQSFDPTGPRGRHYSDWENIRVRVTDRNAFAPGTYQLSDIEISFHQFNGIFAAADPRLQFVDTHPIVYSAKDSHAHYVTTGQILYSNQRTIPLGVCDFTADLYDLTGNGQEMLTYLPDKHTVVSSAWPSIATTTPDWFFFGGMWGKYETQEFCVIIVDSLTGLEIYEYCDQAVENGKPGLIRRGEWEVTCPQNANLGSLRTSIGALNPAFSPNVTNYALDLAQGQNQLVVTPQASDHEATVEVSVNGGTFAPIGSGPLLGKASDPLTLNDGPNQVDIRVTVQGCDGPIPKTYSVFASVDPSPPPNDDYANRIPIGEGTTQGTLLGATNDGHSSLSQPRRPDVWYALGATADGTMRINTCGTSDLSGLDTVLSVHPDDGMVGTHANEIDANDQWPFGSDDTACPSGFNDSAVAFPVVAGQSLVIRVGDFPDFAGNEDGTRRFLLNVIFEPLDTDFDGVTDFLDNCIEDDNTDQRDTDADGYGNICDPDFNNNGIVDPADFSLLKFRFGQPSFPDQDLNGNGIVDPFDFSKLKSMFGQPPGPSGVAP